MPDPNTESAFENAQTTELILGLEARSKSDVMGVTRFICGVKKQDVPILVDAVRRFLSEMSLVASESGREA